MKVVIAGVNKNDVEVKDIENELHVLQEIVDGPIEFTTLPGLADRQIGMICNEEGLLAGLDVNENLIPWFYVGTVIFVGLDDDFTDLSDEQIEYIFSFFHL